jgi:CMP-N,N'-diacetyllegionaminic acid synthase
MIAAIIPARGGSKGIPRKNMLMVGGKPLIFYSMQVALDSTMVDCVAVTSDDEEILDYAAAFGVYPIRRPDILATDGAPTEPCIRHAIGKLGLSEDDTVVLLQPTSPLRSVDMLDTMLHRLGIARTDAMFTAHEEKYYNWSNTNGWQVEGYNYMAPRLPKQQAGYNVRENGSIYITSVRNWLYYNRFGLKPHPFLIPATCGMELDHQWQVPIFEYVISSGLYRRELVSWNYPLGAS